MSARVSAAITVQAPWALAIARGVKLVENRRRPTSYRGPVAIHCGAKWSRDGAHDPRVRQWWWGEHWSDRPPLDAADHSGAFRNILAVADLIDCYLAHLNGDVECCYPWGDQIAYGTGKQPDVTAWHLVLRNVRPLTVPGSAVGSLAVPWTLSADVAAQVEAQLAVTA